MYNHSGDSMDLNSNATIYVAQGFGVSIFDKPVDSVIDLAHCDVCFVNRLRDRGQ